MELPSEHPSTKEEKQRRHERTTTCMITLIVSHWFVLCLFMHRSRSIFNEQAPGIRLTHIGLFPLTLLTARSQAAPSGAAPTQLASVGEICICVQLSVLLQSLTESLQFEVQSCLFVVLDICFIFLFHFSFQTHKSCVNLQKKKILGLAASQLKLNMEITEDFYCEEFAAKITFSNRPEFSQQVCEERQQIAGGPLLHTSFSFQLEFLCLTFLSL